MNEIIGTKFLGKNLIIFEEIESTQKYLKELDKEKAPNGMVVIAKNQTAGIGTNGRKWLVEKNKNLTFSLLLKPNCLVKEIENLSITIAKTMVDVINKNYGYALNIKYPNDIMIGEKKVGGILTEAVTNNEKVKYIIIGVGLNVNQENFPEEIKNIATSLKKEYHKELDIYEILTKFLIEFEKYLVKINYN